jgi:hypothetical protein
MSDKKQRFFLLILLSLIGYQKSHQNRIPNFLLLHFEPHTKVAKMDVPLRPRIIPVAITAE